MVKKKPAGREAYRKQDLSRERFLRILRSDENKGFHVSAVSGFPIT